MEEKKLEGGFINEVYAKDGVVVKRFTNSELVGISDEQRLFRETRALRKFGNLGLSPRLVSNGKEELKQEFIPGEVWEVKARRGEKVFREAGSLLRQIHEPVKTSTKLIYDLVMNKWVKHLRSAKEVLDYEKLDLDLEIDWEVVFGQGVSRVHRDFWLGNVIGDGEPKVIDWEFSGVGSPYEDFAIVELWILKEFANSADDFWDGYGVVPDMQTVDEFLKARCVEFLATMNLKDYLIEDEDGFYHNKVRVLRSLV